MRIGQARHICILPLLIALLGVAFSAWNALDSASVPCISAGCSLYHTLSFGGFSLWWAGMAVFLLLSLIALFGYAGIGRMLAAIALVGDCVLLVIMILTLPCLACLLEACLLAGCYATFRNTRGKNTGLAGSNTFSIPALLWIWGFFFVLAGCFALRGNIPVWAVQEPQQTVEAPPIRIFFSPSCSACRQLVAGLSPADSQKIIWCPVAENEQDVAIILNLQQRLAVSGGDLSTHFGPALDTQPLALRDSLRPSVLLLQFRMWRNQAHVLFTGNGRLPFVEFIGVPSALLSHTPIHHTTPVVNDAAIQGVGGQSTVNGTSDPSVLHLDDETAGSCGPGATPCP